MRVVVQFDIDNSAFCDPDGCEDSRDPRAIAAVLLDLARRLDGVGIIQEDSNPLELRIRDSNGNKIGELRIQN